MVRLRNEYLRHVQDKLGGFDLTIVVDFDLDAVLYLDGFLDSGALLATDHTIDAVAAQGVKVVGVPGGSVLLYGDSYAYMDESLRPYPKLARGVFLSCFPGYPYKPRQVASAFNGLTVYRTRALMGRQYESWIAEHDEVVCEHVGLHRDMSLWINPRMINAFLGY
jgi:hypothetical protein